MKDKDLARLANIVLVRNHAFTLLNGPTGVAATGLDQDSSRKLRSIIGDLDKDFLGVVLGETTSPSKEIKESSLASTKQPVDTKLKPHARKINKKTQTKAKKFAKATEHTDADVAKRLAEVKAAMHG